MADIEPEIALQAVGVGLERLFELIDLFLAGAFLGPEDAGEAWIEVGNVDPGEPGEIGATGPDFATGGVDQAGAQGLCHAGAAVVR